jgi:hypothetical protein
MSRQNLIALVGSVAFVLLVFWLVTLAFPGQAAILGKWRIKGEDDCNQAFLEFTFTKDAIVLQAKGDVPRKVASISAIETSGGTPRLRFHMDPTPALEAYAPYQIAGDVLTFQHVDWTPETRNAHPNEVATLNTMLAAKGESIGDVVTRFQPFRRCPN